MPLSKQKKYSRFNVRKMMKEKKKCREEAAAVHSSVLAQRKVLEAEKARFR
jgi:hypothetical protein